MAQGEALIDNIIHQYFIRPVTGVSDICALAFLVPKPHNAPEARLVVELSQFSDVVN